MTSFCNGVIADYSQQVQNLLIEILIWKILVILAFAGGIAFGAWGGSKR